ncbi:peptide synthetase [Bacteroidia bacterium]|nr:peptide synthetase [Bacteroidia bacterium]
MLENAAFHHVGIAAKSIHSTSVPYTEAGYHLTETVFDPIQNVKIAFLEKAGSPRLELVEPVDNTSPVYNIIKKVGVSAYHFCYEVENLPTAIETLEAKGFRVLVEPVPAIAFDNRKICFLYHLDVGLIELLEQKKIIDTFVSTLTNFGTRKAFCIDGHFYTYDELAKTISKIRKALQHGLHASKNIGFVANDDIETYASIYAIWLEGLTYVPLHPQQPIERNQKIIAQAEITVVLSSNTIPFSEVEIIDTQSLVFDTYLLDVKETTNEQIAYILFTSGSTGKPKGVPVTFGNLNAFVDSFWDLGYTMDENDRVLQPFDLTFDLSVMSYLIPALRGACVYTVPHDQIKYSYIAELLEDQELTFALMVPSTIRYLRPYFDELNLPALKYSLFCGEALPLDLTEEWSRCIPNAFIDNVYGPTEDTIFCSRYRFNRTGENKSHNGALCIGTSMNSGEMIIVDENKQPVAANVQGELCLAGKQLTPGYWHNPEKNSEAFFVHNNTRFYLSGDVCYKDEDGDILYCGRVDSQVKVQGFRIELGEIDFHAKAFVAGHNAVSVAFDNASGNTEIALFVEFAESNAPDLSGLTDYLQSKLPAYMIPTKIISVAKFPLNANGKTDKHALKKMI